jgi:hypothetical protein
LDESRKAINHKEAEGVGWWFSEGHRKQVETYNFFYPKENQITDGSCEGST